MKVELLTPDKEKEYGQFLQSKDQALFNASLLQRDFIRTLCPDAIPYYFIAIEDGEIIGALPSFMKKGKIGPVLNSLPWFGSNPGIVTDSMEAFYMLLQAFENTAKWTDCFSSTIISPPNQDQEIYENYFDNKEVFCDYRTGLITQLPEFKNYEQFATDLMKKFHQKTRNQIVKAIQNCKVYESYGEDDWEFLIKTHKENMKAVGAFPKEKEFGIIKKNFKSGVDYRLYVALANDNQERCGALLVENFNQTVEYIVPAVKVEYRHLNPMNLLVFSAMGDAAQKGFKYWNWGGTKLPQQGGVYHFKKRFGAGELEYKYYTRIHGYLSFDITKKWLNDNYPYFFVMPSELLDSDDFNP
jgi:hypothetical protein